MNLLKPYWGRIIFTVLGLVAAILFLTIGFGKTILILLCCGIGFAVGVYLDKGLRAPAWLTSWRNRW